MTGASKGIGRATAELLASRGYTVFGTSRQPEKVGTVNFTLLPLDVRDDASVAACIQSVTESAGRLDVLVNNAGVALSGAIEEASLDEAKTVFEVNFFGVMRMVKAALPVMRAQGSGHIINLSSLGGLVGVPYLGLYTASKFALEGYSETLRYELKDFGIYVSLVEPGDIRTDIEANALVPAHLIPAYDGTREQVRRIHAANVEDGPAPEMVAKAILRLIESKSPKMRQSVTKGEQFFVPIMRRLLPPFLVEWIIRDAYKMGKG